MSNPQHWRNIFLLASRLQHSQANLPQRDANVGAATLAIGDQPFDQPPLPSSFFLSAEAAEEEASSGSPFSILASILGKSSGSGFRSRAWAHWNLASSVRPTRQ